MVVVQGKNSQIPQFAESLDLLDSVPVQIQPLQILMSAQIPNIGDLVRREVCIQEIGGRVEIEQLSEHVATSIDGKQVPQLTQWFQVGQPVLRQVDVLDMREGLNSLGGRY